MPVSAGIVHQREIESAVKRAARSLAPDVVRIRYTLEEDSGGDDAISFRVLLTDEAADDPNLYEAAQRIKAAIRKIVKPEKYGLESYFNFRSVTEQADLKEKIWE
jgi:hypothetical protein